MSQLFFSFAKYPNFLPSEITFFHNIRSSRLPAPDVSSAKHTWQASCDVFVTCLLVVLFQSVKNHGQVIALRYCLEQMSEAPSIIKRAGRRYVLTRIVSICGQTTLILCNAAWINWINSVQFSELKALLATSKVTASVLSSSNMHRILWIAASAPDCNPVIVWTPIGLTPGFLSRGINGHDT